ISLQRGADQLECLEVSALLVSNDSEQMERIKLIGLRRQNVRIAVLSFYQPALLVKGDRLIEQLRRFGIFRPSGRWLGSFRWRSRLAALARFWLRITSVSSALVRLDAEVLRVLAALPDLPHLQIRGLDVAAEPVGVE